MDGTIKFPGNPWPAGHKLKTFDLGVVLHESQGAASGRAALSLRFRTEDYQYPQSWDEASAASAAQSDDISDWEAVGVWLNYKRAHATALHRRRDLVIAEEASPFDLACFDRFSHVIDPISAIDTQDPDYFETLAFESHVLGWDSMADHHLTIVADSTPGQYRIAWNGKIARTYVGRLDFEHTFVLEASGISFAGYSCAGFDWDGRETVPLEERESRLRALAKILVVGSDNLRFEPAAHHSDDRLVPEQLGESLQV